MMRQIGEYNFIMDDINEKIIDEYGWTIEKQPHNCIYLLYHYKQSNGVFITIKFHRLISGATTIKDGLVYNLPVIVDHKDRNTLNNVVSNLRFSTKSQNAMNSKVPTDNTSGYKGVSWKLDKKKWKAYLTLNGKQFHLGYFDKIEDAIEARIKGARSIFGEFFAEEIEVK
jgi:hypothetical protein